MLATRVGAVAGAVALTAPLLAGCGALTGSTTGRQADAW